MNTDKLLRYLEERGLKMNVVDGRPVLTGPPAMVTPALRKVVQLHREKLLAILNLPTDTPKPEPEDERWTDAYWKKRVPELIARPVFPPDAEMPKDYRDWLARNP